MFLAILFFDPKLLVVKGNSLCMEAIFANIQNDLISCILGVFLNGLFFGAVFCIDLVWCACRFVFDTFLVILFFDQKRWFCKGYSVWMEAIFENIKNGLISRMLGGFFF